MNREGIKKHKVVFDAWLDGAEVEYSFAPGTDKWRSVVGEPLWHSYLEYRIKPTPKTITRWTNVYPSPTRAMALYLNKREATISSCKDRIACVPVTITYTEGEGLE